MMSEMKRMSLQKFRDGGFLQEVNRQFFHPLGLALEVITDETGDVLRLGGIWDCRDDLHGLVFDDTDLSREKAENVARWYSEMHERRYNALGYMVQPVPDEEIGDADDH